MTEWRTTRGLVLETARRCGEVNRNERALAYFAAQFHRAAMTFYDAMNDGQSETGAFARLPSRKEGIERALHCSLVHSATIVRYAQTQIATDRKARQMWCGRIEIETIETESDHAIARRHRVGGVRAEIHQYLVELRRVAADARRVGRDLRFKRDTLRQGGSQHVERLGRDFGRIQNLSLGRCVAAEGEDLTHERNRAQAGLFNLAHMRFLIGRQAILLQQHG